MNKTQLNQLSKGLDKCLAMPIDAKVKVGLFDIHSGFSYQSNGSSPGWAASIIKVPIMASVLDQIEKGNLNLEKKLRVDHRFKLESYDPVSCMPQGSEISIPKLINYMISNSDNEATNMLVNAVGLNEVNKFMWGLGMNRTMLGHLLCYNAPRSSSEFNPEGSNVTCAEDMVSLMRHLYDTKYSRLSPKLRATADFFMKRTGSPFSGIPGIRSSRSKPGYISDDQCGSDLHHVGIINNRLLFCLMANKIGQEEIKNAKPLTNNYYLLVDAVYAAQGRGFYESALEDRSLMPSLPLFEVGKLYHRLMDTTSRHLFS